MTQTRNRDHNTSPIKKWSQFYSEAGLRCIPLTPRDKCVDVWLMRKWIGLIASLRGSFDSFGESNCLTPSQVDRCIQEGSNLGIAIDSANHLVVLDFDEDDSFKHFQAAHPHIATNTPVTQTRRGFHLYLRIKDPHRKSGKLRLNGVIVGDIKTFGFIVAPPSIHPTGTSYQWLNGQSPLDCQPLEIESLASLGYDVAYPDRLPLGIGDTFLAIFKISLRDTYLRTLWRLGIKRRPSGE